MIEDCHKQNQRVRTSTNVNGEKAVTHKVIREELLQSLPMKHEWLEIKDNQLYCKERLTLSGGIPADLLKNHGFWIRSGHLRSFKKNNRNKILSLLLNLLPKSCRKLINPHYLKVNFTGNMAMFNSTTVDQFTEIMNKHLDNYFVHVTALPVTC